MAKSLDQLTELASPVGGDNVLIQQGATAYKTTVAKIGVAVAANVGGDILPDMTGATGTVSVRNIGSSTQKFNTIWAHDLQLDANSLYVNGKKVIEDASSTMTFSTDPDQALEVRTSSTTPGTGNGSLSLSAGNQINMTAGGDVQFTVSNAAGATKGLSFSNQSAGGNITFSTPNGSAVFNQNVAISGNLTVSGTTVTMNTETVLIEDNMIQLNSSQVGAPAATLVGGIEINRGDELKYRFVFEELTDTFKIGEQGSLQAVATREDTPIDGGLAVWSAADHRFNTISGSVPIFTSGTAFPESPKGGDECFRTDLDEFYKYTGAVWVQI